MWLEFELAYFKAVVQYFIPAYLKALLNES